MTFPALGDVTARSNRDSLVTYGRPHRRRFRRALTLPTLAIIGIVVLFSSPVNASLIIRWTPTYSGTGYLASPHSGTNSGSVTFGVPPSFSQLTGLSSMNYTAISTGAAPNHKGAWTVSGAYAGESISYTCNTPCATGSHTVLFYWNVSWNWSLISACPSGGSGSAHLTVSLVSQIYDIATGTTIASSTTSLSNPAALTACPAATSGGVSSPLPAVRAVSASLSAGSAYDFIGFVYSDATTAYCTGGGCTGATSADFYEANFDLASGGAGGILNSVALQ